MIAWLPFHRSANIASIRLRCLYPIQHLKLLGIESELFDYANIENYHTIIFVKAYSAEDIVLAEKLKEKGKQIIFDICDNHSAINMDDIQYIDKVNRLNKMLSIADKVTVPTHELGVLLKAQNFLVVPDALENISPSFPISPLAIKNNLSRIWKQVFNQKPPLRLIWFGNAGDESPRNGMHDLKHIENDLLAVKSKTPFRLDVLSNCETTFNKLFSSSSIDIHFHKWNPKKFRTLMYHADICLIPVTKNSITQGKSANRVITSLLLNTPVIADSIASYQAFKPFIHTGSWAQNIISISQNSAKEKQRVLLGKDFIFEKYTPENIAKQWAKAIDIPSP